MSERFNNPLDPPIINSPRGVKDSNFDSSAYSKADFTEGLDVKEIENKNIFLEKLTGNERWLDLGSGLGSGMIEELVKINKINPNNLISLDLDMQNLKYQKTIGAGRFKINADAASLPFEDQSIDVAFIHWMMVDNHINLIDKNKDITSEINRVVKEDGLLITSDLDELLTKVANQDFKFQFGIGHLRFYKKESSNIGK